MAAASLLAGCGGGAASPSKVASVAGATTCDNSGFYVQSKLTGHKDVIYDCRFARKLPKCVTYSGNIANDATGEVQLLFSGSLNARKPACLSWVAAARKRLAQIAARKAAAKRLARQRAFAAELARTHHEPWHSGYYTYWDGVGSYQLPNVYYKFLSPSSYSCPQYSSYTCWKVEIVTRNGCPNGGSIEFREFSNQSQNSPQLGTAYGPFGTVTPLQPTIVEIDADQTGVNWATIGSITCY
jgi:hypothetical protein